MNRNRNRRFTAVAAVAASLASIGAIAGPAHAASFPFDHDDMTLVATQASLTFSGVDWSQEIGGNVISGRLSGTLTYHGGLAGCARVVTRWRSSTGAVLDTDFSPEVCSPTSLPAVPKSFADSASSSALRSVRVELQVRTLNTGYSTIAAKSVVAGNG